MNGAPRSNAVVKPGFKLLAGSCTVIGFAALSGWASAVLLRQRATVPQLNASAVLIATGEALAFGRVPETSSLKRSFRLENVSDRAITITRFQATCDCLGVTPSGGVTLQPGESAGFTVELRLLLRAAVRDTDGEPLRVQLRAVYTTTDEGAPEQTAEWELTGTIVPTIQVRPALLHLGSQSERRSSLEGKVRVTAARGVRGIECQAPAGWEAAATETRGTTGNAFEVTIRSCGKLSPREIDTVIRVIPISEAGERLPGKEVKLQGVVVRDVAVYPGEVHFGRQARGGEGAEAVQLRSLTGRPFRIVKVASSSQDLAVTRDERVRDGWVYALRLRFAGSGEQVARVVFHVREEDGIEYEVRVPVRYFGVTGS